MPPLLEIKNLKTFLLINGKPFPVVRGINLTLHSGKTIALVGETGCGKSMTALSIMGIAPQPPTLPPEGEVLFKGINLLTLSADQMRQIRGRHMAMIFQDPRSALNPVYSIGEQIMETCQAHLKLSPEEARIRTLAAVEEVQLPYVEKLIELYPHQLSGGMLQRVMIAMALICEPEILIADEPTTSLDVTIQKQILDLLKLIQKRRGMGLLLISHNMDAVAEIADEVIVLYAGEMIEQATTADLLLNPSHPYTQALLAARPTRPLREGRLPTLDSHVPSLTQMPTGCLFHPRCQYGMPQCSTQLPPLFTLANRSPPTALHQTKCWLFDPDLEWKINEEADF